MHFGTVELRAGVQRQLQQRATGQQHLAHCRVVSKPRVGLQRKSARKQPFTIGGDRQGRIKQWLIGRAWTRGSCARNSTGGRVEPIAAALECIGRQEDRQCIPSTDYPLPIEGCSVHAHVCQGPQETPYVALAATQRARHGYRAWAGVKVIDSLLSSTNQDRMGRDLNERSVSFAEKPAYHRLQLDRLA